MPTQKDLFKTLVDLIDGIVEVLLSSSEPLLGLHAKAHQTVDGILRQFVVHHKDVIPPWVWRRQFLAFVRMSLLLPTVILLSWGHTLVPAVLVLVVHVASFLERVIPETWVNDGADSDGTGEEQTDVHAEEETFEVVTTGSPHCMPSWARMHRARLHSSFTSSMVDRAFAIVCWIALLHSVSETGRFHLAQYFTMTSIVVMTSAHGYLALYKFYTTNLISPPHMPDADIFHPHTIDLVLLDKLKRTIEFAGLALFILPLTRYLGLLLSILILPLEYELLREEGKKRVLYYVESGKSLDHKKLKEWMQLKSLASKLIVGISRSDAMDMVMNACASNTVDEVIVEAPNKVDLLFIEKNAIDFIIVTPGQTNVVTDEVLNAERVLILGDQGHLRRVLPKAAQHKE